LSIEDKEIILTKFDEIEENILKTMTSNQEDEKEYLILIDKNTIEIEVCYIKIEIIRNYKRKK